MSIHNHPLIIILWLPGLPGSRQVHPLSSRVLTPPPPPPVAQRLLMSVIVRKVVEYVVCPVYRRHSPPSIFMVTVAALRRPPPSRRWRQAGGGGAETEMQFSWYCSVEIIVTITVARALKIIVTLYVLELFIRFFYHAIQLLCHRLPPGAPGPIY